jgi:hypothetical protein
MNSSTINFRRIVLDAPTFSAAIERLEREGLSRGRAIMLGASIDEKPTTLG